jgi:hypothetical protein
VSSFAPEFGRQRPDLIVPLLQDRYTTATVTRLLIMMRTPAFGHAQRRNLWLVAMSVTLVVVGEFALIRMLRGPTIICGGVLMTYGAMRAALLTVLRRRQYLFEPMWLARQSAALRTGEFEVIRFMLNDQMYDLSDPDVVGELLHRLDDDDRVTLDIQYAPSEFERVYARLRDVRYRTVLMAGTVARAQFPDAYYGLRPSGMVTYWVLGGRVILTVAALGGPARPRDGTGSKGRLGGGFRADECLP